MTAIDDKWLSLGGPNGFLGQPQDEGGGSAEAATPDGQGRMSVFQGGAIRWTPEHGTVVEHNID